jgi:hypothetical protein
VRRRLAVCALVWSCAAEALAQSMPRGAFEPEDALDLPLASEKRLRVLRLIGDADIELSQLRVEMLVAGTELQKAFAKPNVKMSVLVEAAEKMGDVLTRMKLNRLLLMVRVREELTPEQRLLLDR